MSQQSPSPLFSLVRIDDLQTQEGLSYSSGSVSADYHDEVLLVDAAGEPCAYPVEQEHVPIDMRYDYVDGSRGQAPRLLRHRIALHCDYLSDEVRRKLLRWMHDRAQVHFTPGWGRRTELAWRPTMHIVSSHLDLTGRHTLTRYGEAATSWSWDAIMHAGHMIKASLLVNGLARRLKTPAGAAQVFERQTGTGNVADPPYPTGATNALSGWEVWGAGAGTITRSYLADGFGFSEFPGALRALGSASSSERVLGRVFPHRDNATGTLTMTVWLKGKFGSASAVTLYSHNDVNPTSATVSLAGMDLSEWTAVSVHLYASDFAITGAYNPYAAINLTSVDADTVDVLVGPCVVQWIAATADGPGFPHYKAVAARTSYDAYRVPSTSFAVPTTGTLFFSFFVPSYLDWTQRNWFSSLAYPSGGYYGQLFIRDIVSHGSTPRVYFYWGNGSSDYSYAHITLTSGRAHCIAVSVGHRAVTIYHNGVAVVTRSGARTLPTTAVNYFIGSTTTRSTWPLLPLACRWDREVFTADRIMDVSQSMTHNGALEATIPARGRTYRIVEVPSTPRGAHERVHWIGTLELEQTGFDRWYMDQTTKEP